MPCHSVTTRDQSHDRKFFVLLNLRLVQPFSVFHRFYGGPFSTLTKKPPDKPLVCRDYFNTLWCIDSIVACFMPSFEGCLQVKDAGDLQ